MEDFIFSLNCTMPVFLVMVLGQILYRQKMLTQSFIDVCNKFVFKISLPFMLFRDMASMNLKEEFDIYFVLFCGVSALIGVALAWVLARVFIKDKSIIAEWVQGSYRGSIAVLGGAFLLNIYPNGEATKVVAQALLSSVIIFNVMAVVVLVLERPNSEDKSQLNVYIKKAVFQIIQNPLIISILLGAFASLIHLKLPYIIDKTMANIASLTSPLALLAVGAEFKVDKMKSYLKTLLSACAYKLLIQPAIFLPIAVLLDWRNEWLVTLMIMLGAPTTTSSFIMAKNMGYDGSMTTNIIAGTTLFSAASVTLWLFLGRSFGLII